MQVKLLAGCALANQTTPIYSSNIPPLHTRAQSNNVTIFVFVEFACPDQITQRPNINGTCVCNEVTKLLFDVAVVAVATACTWSLPNRSPNLSAMSYDPARETVPLLT